MRTLRRLVVAVPMLLVCSCTDDQDARTTSTTEPTRTPGAGSSEKTLCEVLSPTLVSDAIGIPFDVASPIDNGCTYSSTTAEAAVVVQATSTAESGRTAVSEAQAACDAGSVHQLIISEQPGFSCSVGDVHVVAVSDDDVFVALTGLAGKGVVGEQLSARFTALLGLVLARS